MTNTKQLTQLTPRQADFMRLYTSPDSPSFSNCYQSAIAAGYSDQFARNLIHLNPSWLSTSIGQIAAIQPDELMTELARIIKDASEPTIIRLKAIQLNMQAYSMLSQRKDQENTVVELHVDLTGATR